MIHENANIMPPKDYKPLLESKWEVTFNIPNAVIQTDADTVNITRNIEKKYIPITLEEAYAVLRDKELAKFPTMFCKVIVRNEKYAKHYAHSNTKLRIQPVNKERLGGMGDEIKRIKDKDIPSSEFLLKNACLLNRNNTTMDFDSEENREIVKRVFEVCNNEIYKFMIG